MEKILSIVGILQKELTNSFNAIKISVMARKWKLKAQKQNVQRLAKLKWNVVRHKHTHNENPQTVQKIGKREKRNLSRIAWADVQLVWLFGLPFFDKRRQRWRWRRNCVRATWSAPLHRRLAISQVKLKHTHTHTHTASIWRKGHRQMQILFWELTARLANPKTLSVSEPSRAWFPSHSAYFSSLVAILSPLTLQCNCNWWAARSGCIHLDKRLQTRVQSVFACKDAENKRAKKSSCIQSDFAAGMSSCLRQIPLAKWATVRFGTECGIPVAGGREGQSVVGLAQTQ